MASTDNIIEIWKTIPDWQSYEVSTLGRVRRRIAARTRKAGGILKPDLAGSGKIKYYQIELFKNGFHKREKIHTLVAQAFIGPKPPGHQVNHIDANPLNNHPDNLEYVTPKGNMEHCVKMGRRPHGTAVNTSKLTEDQVRQIRKLFDAGVGGPTIARMFGIRHPSAYQIRDRKIWKHV